MIKNVKCMDTVKMTFRMYHRWIYHLYYNVMPKNYCSTYFSPQVNVFHILLFLILSSGINK